MSDEERAMRLVRPVAGRLVAVLDGADAPTNVDAGGLFDRAIANAAAETVDGIDVMRVTDECRLFVFKGDEPPVSPRILDLESLLQRYASGLSPIAQRAATLGPHGALVGVPNDGLLMVFFVDSGDLMTGAVNVAANVRANYDETTGLSPWMYWVRGAHVEEMQFEADDEGDITSIAFPRELAELLGA